MLYEMPYCIVLISNITYRLSTTFIMNKLHKRQQTDLVNKTNMCDTQHEDHSLAVTTSILIIISPFTSTVFSTAHFMNVS